MSPRPWQRYARSQAQYMRTRGRPIIAEAIERHSYGSALDACFPDLGAIRYGKTVRFQALIDEKLLDILEHLIALDEIVHFAVCMNSYGEHVREGVACFCTSTRVRYTSPCFVPYVSEDARRAYTLATSGRLLGASWFNGSTSKLAQVAEASARLGGLKALRQLLGIDEVPVTVSAEALSVNALRGF